MTPDTVAAWLTYEHANGAASDAYTAHRRYIDADHYCPACGKRAKAAGLCARCEGEA